jgi:predicted metal-dependent hydrolase
MLRKTDPERLPWSVGARGYRSRMETTPRPDVEVRRSKRRRRTVSAYREGDRIVILIPASLSRRQEAEWIETMVARVEKAEARRRPSDDELLARALELSRTWLSGRALPATVRWVDNQRSRWGSCTPVDRSIRLSRRLQDMPDWVIDYVIVHELAHLIEPGHNDRFWRWVGRYPEAERAKAWLDGYSTAARLEPTRD